MLIRLNSCIYYRTPTKNNTMTKIIDFVAEAAKRGNARPLELTLQEAEAAAIADIDIFNAAAAKFEGLQADRYSLRTSKMLELSPLHTFAGFKSRREYFWRLSQMYQMDVSVIEHWALDLGTENDFTLLIEKIHEAVSWEDDPTIR